MERRVVITAAAAITPIGHSKEEIIDSLVNGISGVKKLREDEFFSHDLHSKVFGTVDYSIDFSFERQFRKTMGPVAYYACQVAKEVIGISGLESNFISSGRLGVAFGSTHGSPTVQREIYQKLFQDTNSGASSFRPAGYLKLMVHTTAANIAKMFSIKGRVISSCTACTTSSQSIGYGYEAVKYGMQDAMICGGADEYDISTVAVFDNLLACSISFNNTPHLTPRPFDVNRDGLVVAEGAGAVLLEEYEFAKKRDANILAEVIGFSCNNNGGDMIFPDLNGITQTLKLALHNAKISPDEVDLISAHATATKKGDEIEAQAIHAVYGNQPYVTGFKGYTGHTMGSCGVIETIITLYLMEEGIIVPTLNLENVDENCSMIRHSMEFKEHNTRIAAIQNFAFGGVNTCLVIKEFQ